MTKRRVNFSLVISDECKYNVAKKKGKLFSEMSELHIHEKKIDMDIIVIKVSISLLVFNLCGLI